MEQEDRFLQKRIQDLAQRSYQNDRYTYTGFLSMGEQDVFYRQLGQLAEVEWKLWGGTEGCERQVLRFGGVESLGYEEEFPIACIAICPVMEKFADKLGHRDYLGALMNLGIERSTLGDIIQKDNRGYLFCLEQVADYITEHLDQVKHTNVRCQRMQEIPEAVKPQLQEASLVVSSLRVDGIVARLYHLSRSQSMELFREKKIAVNGKLLENNSGHLKAGDLVSVRGYGRFIYEDCHATKKGRLGVRVRQYV